jgi:hypothetical protein
MVQQQHHVIVACCAHQASQTLLNQEGFVIVGHPETLNANSDGIAILHGFQFHNPNSLVLNIINKVGRQAWHYVQRIWHLACCSYSVLTSYAHSTKGIATKRSWGPTCAWIRLS